MREAFSRLVAVAILLSAAAVFSGGPARAAAAECSAEKRAEILAPARGKDTDVLIDCSITLKPGDVVTKRLIFRGKQASGVMFDCNGGTIDGLRQKTKEDTIEIVSQRRSRNGENTWIRPENVTIRNCTLKGSVHVIGMGRNGQGRFVKESSFTRGHTKRAQDAAPRNVTLSKMTIEAKDSRTPIYLGPGATYFTLEDSVLSGQSNALGVYLDAESAYNTFRNNTFRVKTEGREIIAVDGSADNLFVGNRFSALQQGGIYIYRNCGEGGTVRHLEPRRNKIINNVFYYKDFSGHTISIRNWTTGSFNMTGKVPAVWVGSRGGMQPWCGSDSKYPFGSGKDNGDFARDNVIAQNQVVELSAKDMIEVDDKPNTVFDNESVKEVKKRASGCYVENGFPKPFIGDGETIRVMNKNGKPVCTGTAFTCRDGIAVTTKVTCGKE